MDFSALGNFILAFFNLLAEQQDNNVPETRPSPKSVPHEEFDTIKNALSALTNRVKELETKLESSDGQNLKDKDKDQVVFSAALGPGNYSYGPYDIDTILKFRTVITNIGDAYDKDTGYFVAPFSGIYYFVLFMHAGGEHKSNLYLYKGGERIVQVQNHKLSSEKAANGGNAVFLKLEKNNKVYIIMDKGTHVWVSDTHTTFSCFLVKKTEAEKADSQS